MDIQRADHATLAVDHQQRVDLVRFHQLRGFGRERIRVDGDRAAGHEFLDAGFAHIGGGVGKRAAQVAVGVQPHQPAVGVDYRGHAQAFAAHFQQRVAQAGIRTDAWNVVAGMHHIRDVQQQPAAERAGRMRTREVLGSEAAGFEQCDRERIAHRQRSGGAGCRRQRQRAGFGGHADVQMQVGFAGHGRLRSAGHRDHQVALALEHRQQGQDFVGFAGIRQREHHVAVGDHAQIAVTGFARMHVKGRSAGGGEGRGDLARDVAGFAHADADHASLAGQQGAADGAELPVQSRCDRREAVAFDLEYPAAAVGQGCIRGHAPGRDGLGQ